MRLFFEPRSIAVIGASRDRGKIGSAVLRNILSGGYLGKVFPVNPAGGEVEGLRAYHSIAEIGEPVDVACITIPSRFVYDAVAQCADRGVRYGIIITAGFSEIGNLEEERKIADYAQVRGMRILGPNVFGVYSSSSRMNATFVSGNIPSGHLAMITQSGALGLTLIGQATVENIGLSAIVSVGNKADIDEGDLLPYLFQHEETRMILMYIEGIRDGEKFIRIIKQGSRMKPVVVIKSGRSKRGAMAAASHTGALAGSDEVFDDIVKQCGVLRAESTKEAFNWCKFIADNPLPAGERTVIITNGGGAGVMATDACEKYDVRLYDDQDSLKKIFAPVTPEIGSTKNPIDITGQAASEDYTRAFDAALNDENIDTVIGVYCETALVKASDLDAAVEKNFLKYRKKGKVIIFSLFGGPGTAGYESSARKRGIPVTDDVYEAVSTLGAMYRYKRYLNDPPEDPFETDIDLSPIESIVAGARADGRHFLLPPEAQGFMNMAGIATPKSIHATSIDSAIHAARDLGYPVVMKIISRDILHKFDVGGVALNLENDGEVIDAYGAILRNCRTAAPRAVLEGVSVSEMVRPDIELIIGARIDPSFGPLVMVGLGGTYVEVMKDVSFRSVPLDRREILSMIKQIQCYPLLLGVRGEKMRDLGAVVDSIAKLATIIRRCRVISDIEINPLVVYEQSLGVKAVDVRIILKKT